MALIVPLRMIKVPTICEVRMVTPAGNRHAIVVLATRFHEGERLAGTLDRFSQIKTGYIPAFRFFAVFTKVLRITLVRIHKLKGRKVMNNMGQITRHNTSC
jgi:hypothetical protein